MSEIIDKDSPIWKSYPYNIILREIGDIALSVHAVRLAYIVIDAGRYGYVNINKMARAYSKYLIKYYNVNVDSNVLVNVTVKALSYLSKTPIYIVNNNYFFVPWKFRKTFLRKYSVARLLV